MSKWIFRILIHIDEEFNKKISPLFHVDKIKSPLLIGQGANDPRVKQAEADQIAFSMQKKGIPVEYVLYPDEGKWVISIHTLMIWWIVKTWYIDFLLCIWKQL